MAKRKYQCRTRAHGFGQLMWLAAALMNTPLCLAEMDRGAVDGNAVDGNAVDASNVAALQQSSHELLLYLGEFDPELDPVELSQMGDVLEAELDVKTEPKPAAEASARAANEPKN